MFHGKNYSKSLLNVLLSVTLEFRFSVPILLLQFWNSFPFQHSKSSEFEYYN